MPSENTLGSISICLDLLKRGDGVGAQRLWEAYFHRLVRLACQRLGQVPRRAADEEDVALSAFKSFVLRAEAGKFPRLDDREDLWQILYVITVRKSISVIRRESRHNAVVSLSDLAVLEEGGPIDSEPTPELAAQFAEELHLLLDQLGDPILHDIALWRMEGYTNKEIAGRIGVIEQTVERKLRRIREIWGENEHRDPRPVPGPTL
jgi:DNA-directed RNA polymerase specialized sigma24 family protein